MTSVEIMNLQEYTICPRLDCEGSQCGPGSTDVCTSCMDDLATVVVCDRKHRVLCQGCYDFLVDKAKKSNKSPKCPICRESFDPNRSAVALQQCRKVSFSETESEEGNLQIVKFGFSLSGSRTVVSPNDIDFEEVRRAAADVKAGTLSLEEFDRALSTRLSVAMKQVALLEICKDVDMYKTCTTMYDYMFNFATAHKEGTRKLIVKMVEDTDNKALVARSVLTGAATFQSGILDSLTLVGDGVVSSSIFLVFSFIEVYRWRKGEITTKMMVQNIGEHGVGCGAAAVGSYGGMVAGLKTGAVIGAVAGSAVPVFGTIILGVIFGIVGACIAGYAARKGYRAFVPTDDTVQTSINKGIIDAAKLLGVDINHDDFAVAKLKFRKELLKHHPDKHPPEKQAEMNDKCAELLGCWTLLRIHYEEHDGQALQNDNDEGFLTVYVRKARDTVSDVWKVVRVFFDEELVKNESTDGAEEPLEKTEKLIIYF